MAEPSAAFGSHNPFRRRSTGPPAAAAADAAAAAPPPAFDDDSAADPGSSIFDAAPALPHLASSDAFRSQLQALGQSSQPPPSTTFQKPKVVKKVRVQSPPPSSPESLSGLRDDFPPLEYAEDESTTTSSDDDDDNKEPVENVDPFEHAPPPIQFGGSSLVEEPASFPSHRPPPNPFSKTLEDMEQSSKEQGQSVGTPTSKGSLDVDAFRRLLLTGQAGLPGAPSLTPTPPGANPSTPGGDAGSIADTSSISRQSIFDAAHPPQETPRTSHEISEPEIEEEQRGLVHNPVATKLQRGPSILRKKPPPPSSRHGKMIKVEHAEESKNAALGMEGLGLQLASSGVMGTGPVSPASPTRQQPSSPSDINKPLPPAPLQASTDDTTESIFDKEAAGKLPEIDADLDPDAEALPLPRPPTPPKASNSAGTTGPTQPPKKPPPPPRRQPHGRPESKLTVPSPAVHSEDADQPAPRSSLDSNRSRSSSLRVNVNAPAPPPPRRPNHAPRASSSFTSPSALSFTSSINSTASATSPSASDADQRSPSSLGQYMQQSQPQVTSLAENLLPGPGPTTAPPPGTASLAAASPAVPSGHQGHEKLSPPPPPPARNKSVRSANRPPSLHGAEGISRKVSREKEGGSSMAPPPPPPRARGSSRGSIEAPAVPRRTSIDSVRALGGPVMEEIEPASTGNSAEGNRPRNDSSANDILADLDALQREVEAARLAAGGSGGAG